MSNDTANPHESAQFLSASPARLHLLESLDEAPRCPSELTTRLSLSRRGVQRTLSSLADRGWVVKTDGKYRLTTKGTLVALQYADFLDVLETIRTYETFFTHLPDCEHTPNPRWLSDDEIVVAESTQPYTPMVEYMDGLRACSTTTLRGLTPVLSPFHVDVHAELLEHGVETELVLSKAMAETARQKCPQTFEAALHRRGLELSVYEGTIGLSLTLTDRRILVGAHDEQGRFRACVNSTNSALLDWAERLFERYRERSKPISADDAAAERELSPE